MRFKEVRQARKLTQQQVADLLEIPLRTYQNYEREINEPDTDVLCKMADFYGVTVDYLVGYSDIAFQVNQQLTPEESRLVDAYRQLSKPYKHAVMILAEGLVNE